MVRYLYRFYKSAAMKKKMIIPISVFAVSLGSAYNSDVINLNSVDGDTKTTKDTAKKSKTSK